MTDEMRVAIFLEVLEGRSRQVDIAKKHNISSAGVKAVVVTVVNKVLGKNNTPRDPATKSPYVKEDFAKHRSMKTAIGIQVFTQYSAGNLHSLKLRTHKEFWHHELKRYYPDQMKEEHEQTGT